MIETSIDRFAIHPWTARYFVYNFCISHVHYFHRACILKPAEDFMTSICRPPAAHADDHTHREKTEALKLEQTAGSSVCFRGKMIHRQQDVTKLNQLLLCQTLQSYKKVCGVRWNPQFDSLI